MKWTNRANSGWAWTQKFRVGLLTLAVGSTVSTPTYAQELEEILVTAQRRAQSIQDVGLVVNQFSNKDLRELAAVDTTDLAQFVPGVFVAGAFGGQSQQFNIRGVTQSDYLDTIENPVAFYIDDVYITAAQGQTMSFFDLERVEILKGPQGTLFGRNATGGLVHTVVAKPDTEEVSGYVEVSYGTYDEINAQGALNLPLGEKAALRVSALRSQIDDYWENKLPDGQPGSDPILSFDPPGGNTEGVLVMPRGDDVGGSESTAGRIQLLFQPSDSLGIRLTSSFAKTEMSSAPYTQEATIAIYDEGGHVVDTIRTPPDETRMGIGFDGSNIVETTPFFSNVFARPVPGGDFFGYIPLDPDDLELSEDLAQQNLSEVKSAVHAMHIEYDFGNAVLNSVTAIQDFDKDVLLGDGSPANTLGFANVSETESISQELRLSGDTDRSRWQLGVFYLDSEVSADQGILMPVGSSLANIYTGLGIPPEPNVPQFYVENGMDMVTPIDFTSESWSVFGQLEFDFADNWTLIAGLRLIEEDQTYDYALLHFANADDYRVETDVLLFPGFQPAYDDSRSESMWAGKLQLEYRASDDLLFYGGINRGVKAGNYNAPFAFNPEQIVEESAMSYDPEELLSYEGGFKYSSGNWILNASAFFYDYADFQAFVFSTASGVVRNVDSDVYGVDIETSVQLTDSFRLGVSYALSHAELSNFELAPGVFTDVRPPYSPRHQAGANLNYTSAEEVMGGQFSILVAANYTDEIYHNVRNFEAHKFDGRTLVNLSASWRSNESGFSVTLFGRNVTDERYGMIGFDNATIFGGQNVSYGKPVSYGILLGYDF